MYIVQRSKSLGSLSSAQKNGGKNKSVAFIILFSVYTDAHTNTHPHTFTFTVYIYFSLFKLNRNYVQLCSIYSIYIYIYIYIYILRQFF